MRTRRLLLVAAPALGLVLALLWTLVGQLAPAEAMPYAGRTLAGRAQARAAPQAELHVCPGGCDYSSIQDAVDAASPGTLIKVAQGTYSDVHERDYFMQVVYVDKSVTIQGGYTTSDWSTPDPDAHPTVVDAHGQGHAVNIINPSSPGQVAGAASIHATVAGLHLTGGAGSSCGGVWVLNAGATLSGNYIYGNTAEYLGGGICVEWNASAHLMRNVIRDNATPGQGGGLYADSSDIVLVNNVIVDNQADQGAGVYLGETSASLVHTTIARNGMPTSLATATSGGSATSVATPSASSGGGTGVHLGSGSSASLLNTILADQAVGISVDSGSAADVYGVLWFGNERNQDGSGSIVVSQQFVGDPHFAPDGYHLLLGSAAIDRGVSGAAAMDIDGEPRPLGAAPDLGADEGPVVATISPNTGGTLVYTDAMGLATTVEVPPGGVVNTTTLTFSPLVSLTHPFSPGLRFAGHVFDLQAVVLPLPAAISVTKSASPAEVAEPGGPVTFDVVIANISSSYSTTITSLVDHPYGDLTDPDNPHLLSTDCETLTIPAGYCYHCAFTATVSGEPGDRFTDTLSVQGLGGDDTPVRAVDGAVVAVTDLPSMIEVTKTAIPAHVPEPGGPVTFEVNVENLSAVDVVTITGLSDDVHGGLDSQGSCAMPQQLAPEASYQCAFTATVSGNTGDTETDTVTATAADDDGQLLDARDSAVVTIVDVQPAIQVTKTASPTAMAAPGGPVSFTVQIENLSAVDTVTITTLADDPYGDLDGRGSCATPQQLAPSGFYDCAFTAVVTGSPQDVLTDTVTASGIDDDGHPVTDSDHASVSITLGRVYLPLLLRTHPGISAPLGSSGGPAYRPIGASEPPDLQGSCAQTANGLYPCLPLLRKPMTVTIQYTCADVEGIDEEDLRLYYWTGSHWEDVVNACTPPGEYIRDPDANTLQVPICHLSEFAVGG